jgi:hypothetical protein
LGRVSILIDIPRNPESSGELWSGFRGKKLGFVVANEITVQGEMKEKDVGKQVRSKAKYSRALNWR